MTSPIICPRKRKLRKVLYILFIVLIMVNYILIFGLRGYLKVAANIPIFRLNYSSFDSHNNTKHILLWTRASASPFVYLEKGNTVFVKKRCKWTNCYVTDEPNDLSDLTKFDVIAFNGPQIPQLIAQRRIPLRRKPSQKYVYANIESAVTYPICVEWWNEFFNWTWTYKLNSDGMWGYLLIRNSTNHVIGPSQNIDWLRHEEMDGVSERFKTKLKTKNRAVAWFVSSCVTTSRREKYVEDLNVYLKRFNIQVHIYGECGEYKCPLEKLPNCLKMLQKYYFFYLAFENAISEDYVTEKVLHALQSDTVPIVYGGANYSRFLPSGSYLDALELGPAKLANRIIKILQNASSYYDFFRWKKYYSYHLRHESPETDDYCNFCAMLNNEQLMQTTTIYDHIDDWWMGPRKRKICETLHENKAVVPLEARIP